MMLIKRLAILVLIALVATLFFWTLDAATHAHGYLRAPMTNADGDILLGLIIAFVAEREITGRD